MRLRPTNKLLTTLVAAAAVFGLAATANADHIRVMVVQQDPSTSNTNGYTVGLRVDFNYSGNCCGGYFSFNTGEGRTGGMLDGISNGQPDPDVPNWTTTSFSYAGTRPANEQRSAGAGTTRIPGSCSSASTSSTTTRPWGPTS